MIRFVTQETAGGFLSSLRHAPVLDARIYTLYKLYGLDHKIVSFWTQTSGDMETAAISLCGGHMNISAGRGCDFGELSQFLSFMGGYSSASLPLRAGAALPAPLEAVSAFSMYYQGAPLPENALVTEAYLPDVYRLLRASDDGFSRRTDWNGWYAHVSHLTRRSCGFCAGIYIGGALVSTGGVYAMSPRHALISGIATLPGHKNQGYGGAVVAMLVNRSIGLGLVPVLLASGGKLAGWYEGMGFRRHDGHNILEAIYEQGIF